MKIGDSKVEKKKTKTKTFKHHISHTVPGKYLYTYEKVFKTLEEYSTVYSTV